MKRLKRLVLLFPIFLFVLSPSYSEVYYKVSEEQMKELKKFQIDYENLQKDYQTLQEDLKKQTEDLEQQTKDLQSSLVTLKQQELKTNLIIGGVSVSVGFALGGLIFILVNK